MHDKHHFLALDRLVQLTAQVGHDNLRRARVVGRGTLGRVQRVGSVSLEGQGHARRLNFHARANAQLRYDHRRDIGQDGVGCLKLENNLKKKKKLSYSVSFLRLKFLNLVPLRFDL
jgi:hypothetical protein